MTLLRRLVPILLLPLSAVACGLANTPWLRAYPFATIGVPLFGAALLGLLAPLVVVGNGVRSLWITATVDLVLLVLYELFVVLRDPSAFAQLWTGVTTGPSQILTYALPLVSPAYLLVAPVALCWVSSAIVGECVARGWQTVLPYAALLLAFGMGYAATERSISDANSNRRYDTVLAAGLLLTLLLLRAVRSWLDQDESAESTQPDSLLPLRSLGIGAVLSLVIVLAVTGIAQLGVFGGRPAAPDRVSPLKSRMTSTPIAFVSELRAEGLRGNTRPLFTLTTDHAASRYVSIASLSRYDGDGWTLDKTFSPSGGTVPADANSAARKAVSVDQRYHVTDAALASAPWMPYLDRPRNVAGVTVDVDAASGMIVPVHTDRNYAVRSLATPTQSLDDVGADALPGVATAQDVNVPNGTVTTAITELNQTLQAQIPADASTDPLGFVKAVASQLRTTDKLSTPDPQRAVSTAGSPGSSNSSGSSPEASSSKATPSAAASSSAGNDLSAGNTSFAAVLTSIRQLRTGTPEQFATLMCLMAREAGVPARVVTGFRVATAQGDPLLVAGRTYQVDSAQAYTWVQVLVQGQGWVVVDPSPSTYSTPSPSSSGGQSSAPPSSSTPAQNASISQASSGNPPAGPSATGSTSSVSVAAVILVVGVGVLVLLLLVLLLPTVRRYLRAGRRRNLPDARVRLLGAWLETLDMLQEHGLPDLTHLTSREVADLIGARFGGEPADGARAIGEAANRAIFSPDSTVVDADADTAWREHDELRRAVRGRLDWKARLRAKLRYHRSRMSANGLDGTARRDLVGSGHRSH